MAERWLSRKEAAVESGLSVKSIDRAIRRGLLRKAQHGFRKVQVPMSDVVRLMNGGKLSRV